MNTESNWYPPRGEWLAMCAAYALIVGMAVLVVMGVAGVLS